MQYNSNKSADRLVSEPYVQNQLIRIPGVYLGSVYIWGVPGVAQLAEELPDEERVADHHDVLVRREAHLG